jgi:hypothetical protein
MAILQRLIQKVRPDKWEELEEMDKEWTTIESRYEYPPKTRYVYFSGGYDTDTLVVERLWDSFAAAEETINKLSADPEANALSKKFYEIVESQKMELLVKLEPETGGS